MGLMRNLVKLPLVLGFLALVFPAMSEEAKSPVIDAKKVIPEFSHCVAYALEDTQGGVLAEGKGILDEKILSAATKAKARLSGEQVERLLQAASKDIRNVEKECYSPHHAFVFYDDDGKPVGCIEVCLTCNAAKMKPAPSDDSDNLWRFDMAAMVQLLDDAKLPLTPYQSVEDFKRDKEKEKLFLEQLTKLREMSPEEGTALLKELEKKKDLTAGEAEMLRILRQAQDSSLDAE